MHASNLRTNIILTEHFVLVIQIVLTYMIKTEKIHIGVRIITCRMREKIFFSRISI